MTEHRLAATFEVVQAVRERFKLSSNQNTDRQWPVPDRRWAMRMKWHDLLFMHWPVPIEQIEAYVPPPLTVDTFEGHAWMGIVPFRMSGVSPRYLPDLPWLSEFPELNVRTYVTANDQPGVWFFSLDATNPIAVRVARFAFHLPYMDAKISLERDGDTIKYVSQRTHRNEPPADLDVTYRPNSESFFAQPNSLEFFLTARYCLYAANKRRDVLRGEIDHPPWSLQTADCEIRNLTMLHGLDIELPEIEPHLLFSRSTSVVAWTNQRVPTS